jgi:thiol-disulfide isomerase/thioredoxin
LNEAFERGYEDVEQTRADVDFESIRESEEFVALLEKHEKLIYERMVAETKSELESFETYDFDFELKNIEGEDIRLADYKGKVVIVDFWGTWCPPCVAEIPHFIQLKESYGGQGLEIVGLAYEQVDDEEEALEGVKSFTQENNVNYPCAIGDEATMEKVPDFQGYPTTLFIDREGVVRLQLVGFQPHSKLELVVQHLLGTEE